MDRTITVRWCRWYFGYASLINGGSYYEPHGKEILNDEVIRCQIRFPNLVRETFGIDLELH
ncbi:MAG: hypothetical protein ACLTR6_10605 [Clostridium fessum]